MATPAQIDANRRNAEKSTGPRTEEGKEKSSRNATKFGLFTRHVLLPGEDQSELQLLRDGIHARLKPADVLEELYVERIVSTSWRLQRALSGESAIFAQFEKYSRLRSPQAFGDDDARRDLHQLQKHIASLERSIDKALAELNKLQKLRRELADDENEPNSTATPQGVEEVSALAPIEIVKTNPIQEVNKSVREEADRENEPNSPGGGAFPAPTPVEFKPAWDASPPASMQDERCG